MSGLSTLGLKDFTHDIVGVPLATISDNFGYHDRVTAYLCATSRSEPVDLAAHLDVLDTWEQKGAWMRFFAMDWFSFVIRSCFAVPVEQTEQQQQRGQWSDLERRSLDLVLCMLLRDKASPRELLLAIQRELSDLRVRLHRLASYEDVSSEEEDDDIDAAATHLPDPWEDSLGQFARAHVFLTVCALQALSCTVGTKAMPRLRDEFLDLWLPLADIIPHLDESASGLFFACPASIWTRLLEDGADSIAAVKVVGRFIARVPPGNDDAPQSDAITTATSRLAASIDLDQLLLASPDLADEGTLVTMSHVLALSATEKGAVTLLDLELGLKVVGSLFLFSPAHWHHAYALLAALAAAPPAPPATDLPPAAVDTFIGESWAPFLGAICSDPVVRTQVFRAGDTLIDTHAGSDHGLALAAALAHATPHPNVAVMVLRHLIQPRIGAWRVLNNGVDPPSAFVAQALVPTLVRDVARVLDPIEADHGDGGPPMVNDMAAEKVMVAWLHLMYVVVRSGAVGPVGSPVRALIGDAVLVPLARAGYADSAPPVVQMAIMQLEQVMTV
ncbi:hypothetical protein BC828DRAFT_117891 [Blastocladiella britannica]|nr:hypothetical protein BC828DRAFT_117891 [Blastocladiella britannica]